MVSGMLRDTLRVPHGGGSPTSNSSVLRLLSLPASPGKLRSPGLSPVSPVGFPLRVSELEADVQHLFSWLVSLSSVRARLPHTCSEPGSASCFSAEQHPGLGAPAHSPTLDPFHQQL